MRECSLHKTAEQRMSIARCRRKFRVELTGDKPGMIRYFNDLYQGVISRPATNAQARLLELIDIIIVHFVAVTMPLNNHIGPVNFPGFGTGDQTTLLRTQTHSATEVRTLIPFLD